MTVCSVFPRELRGLLGRNNQYQISTLTTAASNHWPSEHHPHYISTWFYLIMDHLSSLCYTSYASSSEAAGNHGLVTTSPATTVDSTLKPPLPREPALGGPFGVAGGQWDEHSCFVSVSLLFHLLRHCRSARPPGGKTRGLGM